MKHVWQYTHPTVRNPVSEPLRRCAVCGAEQAYYSCQEWGRVVSRRWEPKVSRKCPGPPAAK